MKSKGNWYKCKAQYCGLEWRYVDNQDSIKCPKCGSKDIEMENGKGK